MVWYTKHISNIPLHSGNIDQNWGSTNFLSETIIKEKRREYIDTCESATSPDFILALDESMTVPIADSTTIYHVTIRPPYFILFLDHCRR
jgi:hypothetical protein